MDPFNQVAQTLGKCSRLLVYSATLIVVSELFVITSCLACLRREWGRSTKDSERNL